MFLNAITAHVVKMPVVKIIGVVTMMNRCMTAIRAMPVAVTIMYLHC